MDESRQEREREFHNQEYAEDDREPVLKYYSVTGSIISAYEQHLFSYCRNRKVLDYGCGRGSDTCKLAEHGAEVVGIDISDVGIQLARKQAEEDGLADNIVFSVGDCESLCFADDSFDMLCGKDILHHLQLDKAMREATRVLKPGGRAVFLESLGYNPAINLYRRVTPQFRSADEHPLKKKDLRQIEQSFENVSCEFFYLFSLLAVPFRNTRYFPLILRWLENIDQKIFNWLPPLRLMAWLVIITCEGPRKTVRA